MGGMGDFKPLAVLKRTIRSSGFTRPERGVVELDACLDAAAGSGSHYALGAMYAAYEQGLPAEDIARLGVEAGVEFDHASFGPITLRRVESGRKCEWTRERETLLETV